MARDFMQDILPQDDSSREPRRVEPQVPMGDEVEVPSDTNTEPMREKSIRNINININRQRPPMERPMARPPMDRPQTDRREVPPVGGGMPRRRRGGSSYILWIIAAVLLIAVAVFALMMFRSTSVTVTPRAHTVVFDQTKDFTAYPSAAAPAGALTYAVQTFDVDDSQPVSASGTTHTERKASGTVTVVNAYSQNPVKLVKNTRFETPDGLVFRAPADISIPGTKNGTPGTINVTLIADQSGDKYNIAPTPKFTLPGLQGSPMYDKVYAMSSSAFTGGFSGNEPNVADNVRAAAVAEMEGRLKDKVTQQIASLSSDSGTIFTSFATITFQDMPATSATTQGQVNLNERAHVQVPVFPTQDLNRLIASSVSSDVQDATLTLNPKEGFGATMLNATSTVVGSTPITFAFDGTAQLVWGVDGNALAQALAGKDQSAFQTVVNGFPGVQEARARIEPFWRHTFPTNPKDIKVIISQPQETPSQ